MLSLAVDTATPCGSLAVLEDSFTIGVISTSSQETYSSRMFRHLEFLLAELGLEMGRFVLFSVAAGPGSFTGLRVGLTAVKGWAEVYKKPIAAVSGLEAVGAQARSAPGVLAPVLDARRGQIYGAIYRRRQDELELQGEEMVLPPEEFLNFVRRESGGAPITFVTPTPELVEEHLKKSGYSGAGIERVSEVLAPVIGELGVKRHTRGELVDALRLDANYIRRSDAELLWKGR